MTVCTLWGNRCLHPVKIYNIDLIPYHCTRREKKGQPNPNQILFEAATGVKYLKSIRGRKKYYRRGGGGSSMISACILINMTSSLARQIIPPGLGVQLTLLAALRLEPASFSSHTKKRCQGFLIEINFIPWKSLKSLPPMGRPPLPRSISLTRVGLVLDGDVRMEAWNQVCGVTVTQQRTERRRWILGIWVRVCVCVCSEYCSFPSPLHVVRLSGYWIRWPDYPGLSCGRPLEAWEAPVAMRTAPSRTQHARMSFAHQGHEGSSEPAALSNKVPTGELLLTSIFQLWLFSFYVFFSSVFWHSTESGERLANSATPFRVFLFSFGFF